MPQVYANGFDFEAESGVASCIELPAPARGEVKRLIIKQVSGTLDGFTADLLDRVDACSVNAEVSNSFEPTLDFAENKLLDKELHRIVAQISVAGSGAISQQFNLDAGYQNRDEQDIRRTPNTRIYLDLLPAGSGLKQFQVAYAIEPLDP